MNFNSFTFLFTFIVVTLILSLCIFVPTLAQYGYVASYIPDSHSNNIDISTSNFTWPTPGYTTITSRFGPRKSPTTGVSSFHYGLDIGAPIGANIIAVFSGKVTFTGFKGANGYTVTITNGNISSSYSHVSPNFVVYEGQYINQGEIIAKVGPKNVYGVPNNPYKDSNGNPTNRFYNWTPFTFKYKKRRQSRQSIRLFLILFTCHHLHHDYNVSNRIHIHHVHHIHLPSLILLYYYILGILFHLSNPHIQLRIHYCNMDK